MSVLVRPHLEFSTQVVRRDWDTLMWVQRSVRGVCLVSECKER